jgi:hypothetical protein
VCPAAAEEGDPVPRTKLKVVTAGQDEALAKGFEAPVPGRSEIAGVRVVDGCGNSGSVPSVPSG